MAPVLVLGRALFLKCLEGFASETKVAHTTDLEGHDQGIVIRHDVALQGIDDLRNLGSIFRARSAPNTAPDVLLVPCKKMPRRVRIVMSAWATTSDRYAQEVFFMTPFSNRSLRAICILAASSFPFRTTSGQR